MYSLLLLSSLLHITTSTVYTVTPDDHYCPNTTCHHCPKLQHYLLNVTKYFTSNTQLLFLPGLHRLYTNLIIQNVCNISLIGGTANSTTQDTVMWCAPSIGYSGIVMTNITNLTIKNLIFTDCMANFSLKDIAVIKNESFVVLLNCFQVCMQHVTIKYTEKTHGGLFAFNVLGKFILDSVKSEILRITYNDSSYTKLLVSSEKQNELSIHKFQLTPYEPSKPPDPFGYDIFNYDWMVNLQQPSSCSSSTFNNKKQDFLLSTEFGIQFYLLQTLYNISVNLRNSNFEQLNQYGTIISFTLNACLNKIQNKIFIQGCQFKNIFSYNIIYMSSLTCSTGKTSNEKISIIKIRNCKFIKNRYELAVFDVLNIEDVDAFLYISECLFQDNSKFILKFLSQNSSLTIAKSHFISPNKFIRVVMYLSNVKLIFKGPVTLHGYDSENLLQTNTLIAFYDYVEFSNIKATRLIHGTASYNVHLVGNAYINITNNIIKETMFSMIDEDIVFYPSCYFQFQYFKKIHSNISQIILMKSNSFKRRSLVFNDATGNINCKWNRGSLYRGLNPLNVYKEQFKTVYEHLPFNTGLLCYCPNKIHPNCHTNILMPLYPGQTLILHLSLNRKTTNKHSVPITVKMYDKDFPDSVCTVSTLLEAEQLVEKNCTKLIYNIYSENQQQCKLILYSTEYKYPTVYYINLLKCPPGFSFDSKAKKCMCDSRIQSEMLSIDHCNINDQTILRPANSWISVTTHNNSYTYHISLHCPFHYCLPHSSHLNFSTPNSQCQFNRSGVLCGHCQQGYSTVFGSSNCQHCSNAYISLTIVIAIAGVVLVFLMYVLNLTVANGTINAFVFYVNIISINSPILFPKLGTFIPAYTFISLANLDLGIQTCFYNGMDDYAKMWLQLAFPFYLIFIATLIVITSRYSTTIQRLTACRALQVLATLFLLSYTKILRIVSSVLFSYSTITHLPSKHTTIVWSVDANVPLFGLKFILLFIVCIILFLLLLLFNVVLFFNKTLPKLSLLIKFKSLLDAYQLPYKDKYYYWTDLQLAMRAVLFCISLLERNINLAISILLFSAIEGIHCVLKPFKNKALNYQELLFVLNVVLLYAYILFSNDDTDNTIVVNIMIATVAVHFMVIIVYHIITYVCGQVMNNRMQRKLVMLARWITGKPISKFTKN